LASHGVHFLKWDELTGAQKAEAGKYFDSEISPALTPLVFDPAHPFPFLSNLSTSLAFILEDPQQDMTCYARVKVPSVFKQWIALETTVPARQRAFVPLYEVIRGNVHKLYGGMKLSGTTLFRITRDAEVEIDDESDETLREQVREQVRLRRYEPVVRLEFAAGSDHSIRAMLQERSRQFMAAHRVPGIGSSALQDHRRPQPETLDRRGDQRGFRQVGRISARRPAGHGLPG
jgi:polyphosphate kinase